MRVSIIVAMAQGRVIGRDGDLPWHLPDDLKHFKTVTLGHPVLMGRKTFDSIHARLGKALPGRRNLVLSRDPAYQAPGAETFVDLDQALQAAAEGATDELFVIGGAEIYRLALPRADRLYLTQVDAEVEGDTYFPPLGSDWRQVSDELHAADSKHSYAFRFQLWERALDEPTTDDLAV